jgi:phosphoribosylanthranilate isomerase
MVRIKICGITSIEDALYAEAESADALGFIFYYKSKRFVLPEQVKQICEQLNPFTGRVGVFVNSDADEINNIATLCRLTHIQLHGDETPAFAESLKRPVIRALNFNENLEDQLKIWSGYPVLIDSGNSANRGGTGHTLPWEALKSIMGERKIILAGGLSPENILKAIKTINPFAVDVSSGVEQAPGIKDNNLVKKFIETVKHELL